MKKHLLTLVCTTILSISTFAQSGSGRVSLGTGLLYENGWDVTLGNGYLKWDECASCKHICPDSFWQNYRSYGVGAAYKPCVVRGRNYHGNLRLGASAGSDTKDFLGGLHVGYEHNYALRSGVQLFWQVKSDVMIEGKDLFRTGVVLGVKLPLK